MPRDARAYLADIVESCEAVGTAIAGLDLPAYEKTRLVRSAVEREFMIIGAAIGHARRIVDFRNQLAHEYPTVDDAIVWAIADRDAPVLRRECEGLMAHLEPGGAGGGPVRAHNPEAEQDLPANLGPCVGQEAPQDGAPPVVDVPGQD